MGWVTIMYYEDNGCSMTDGGTQDEFTRPDDPASDPLFGLDGEGEGLDNIFRNRGLLVIGEVPDRDRIVGRDEEMQNVANQIKYITQGQKPNHVIIYGEPGTGKSLVSRHVSQRAIESAKSLGTDAEVVYIECNTVDTKTRVARRIVFDLLPEDADMNVNKRGVGWAEYFENYLWKILDRYYEGVIVILDEIDRLQDDNNKILHELSRAREKGSTDSQIGVIGITNNIQYGRELSSEVKSSMRAEDYVFHPYSADELEAILKKRKDAFNAGVLDDEVIPKIAEVCAVDKGDARTAVDTLRNAGEIASNRSASNVTLEHLDEAIHRAKTDKVVRLIEGTPRNGKVVLYALAKMSRGKDVEDKFPTGEIFDRYETAARDIGADNVSERTVLDRLLDYDYLGVVDSVKDHGGFKKGTRRLHALRKDPDVVLDAVVRKEPKLRELESGIGK